MLVWIKARGSYQVALQYNTPAVYPSDKVGRMLQRALLLSILPLVIMAFAVGSMIAFLPLWSKWSIFLIGLLFAMFSLRWFRQYESELSNYVSGRKGERDTAAILSQLPRNYHIFHGLRPSSKDGDIDHLVIGPTGVFCIDTKNWGGKIIAEPDGEIRCSGKRREMVGTFTARCMAFRELLLNGSSDQPWFDLVFVFPADHYLPKFGTTKRVNCVSHSKLLNYINTGKRTLRPDQIDALVSRATVLLDEQQSNRGS